MRGRLHSRRGPHSQRARTPAGRRAGRARQVRPQGQTAPFPRCHPTPPHAEAHARAERHNTHSGPQSVTHRWYTLPRALRTARREPPADRAGRAAPGVGSQRPDRRDGRRQDGARARPRPSACGAGAAPERRGRAAGRERELDLLEFGLAEIEAVAPDEAEERGLRGERERLRHLEALRAASLGGAEAVAPEAGEGGAGALVAAAAARLEDVAGVDPALDALTERLRAVALEADDVAAELRRYGEGLEAQPGRL